MAKVSRETPGKSNGSSSKTKSTGFLGKVGETSVDQEVGASLVIYGKEGVGKTSLAAFAPSPLFIVDKNEQGIHRLKKRGLVPPHVKVGPNINKWSQLLDAIDEILNENHEFETVVFDSLTGYQRMCFQACCNAEFGGDMSKEGFFSFFQGPRVAAQSYWPDFIDKLSDLQEQNINVTLLAHSAIKTINNPQGPDYDIIMPDLDKTIWAVTSKWAGAVLYYAHDLTITKEKTDRKVKAKGGAERRVYCEMGDGFVAKNSYNLPAFFDPHGSAEECWEELWAGIVGQEEETPKKKKKISR